jgi:hypothetical protein
MVECYIELSLISAVAYRTGIVMDKMECLASYLLRSQPNLDHRGARENAEGISLNVGNGVSQTVIIRLISDWIV